MMTRKALADAIDTLDEQITELQREKAETYAAYRAQLETAGTHKDQIKLELAASKVAIRYRQQLSKDREAVLEKSDLADAIINEICVGTAHAIKGTHAHDARAA